MEASAPRRPGDVTQLINSAVNLPSDGCFVFWYHMFGGNIGTLSIYDNTKVNAPQLLWAQSGDKQDNWLNGRVSRFYHLDLYSPEFTETFNLSYFCYLRLL